MAFKNNLTPTVIADKNGRITTVHKKAGDTAADNRNLPAPSLLRSAFDFGRTKRINKAALINETLDQLEGFIAHDGSPMFNSKQLDTIRDRFDTAKSNKELKTVNAAAAALTHTRDREFIYSTLCQLYPTDGKRALFVIGNHLDLLAENPHNAARLYHLDRVLGSRYGTFNGPEEEIDTLRVHFLAKMSYPLSEGPEYGVGYEESIKYEMSDHYVEFIQKHPELASEFIRFANTVTEERDLNYMGLTSIVKIAEEMPDRLEEFISAVESHGGARSLLIFLDDRGVYEFDMGAIESYIESHGALHEGVL